MAFTSTGMEASFGSLPVIFEPSGRTPLPHWELYGSVCCCGPYLATEKLQFWSRVLAIQPIMGMVPMVRVPVVRLNSITWLNFEWSGRFEAVDAVKSS